MNDVFDKIKTFVAAQKSRAVICVCFVSVYAAGVISGAKFHGSGHQSRNFAPPSATAEQLNYNTKDQNGGGEPAGQSQSGEDDCYIKGNIGSGSRKIYHMPGGSFYDRTDPEMCFNSEEEAVAAGFIKSSR